METDMVLALKFARALAPFREPGYSGDDQRWHPPCAPIVATQLLNGDIEMKSDGYPVDHIFFLGQLWEFDAFLRTSETVQQHSTCFTSLNDFRGYVQDHYPGGDFFERQGLKKSRGRQTCIAIWISNTFDETQATVIATELRDHHGCILRPLNAYFRYDSRDHYLYLAREVPIGEQAWPRQ